MTRIKKILGWLAVASLLLLPAKASDWMSDFKAASAQAARENKLMVLDFTGSDWCGWCIKLKKEVFDQPGFNDYAKHYLVLVELDFPRRKALPSALTQQNEALAEKYGIRGFPTLVILDPQGKEVGRAGYQEGGPPPLLKTLEQLRLKHAPKTGGQPGNAASGSPNWTPPAKAAPARDYSELKLQGISGTPAKRIAMINGASLSAGEDARVQLKGKSVRIHCLEVAATQAKIQVDNEETSRTLSLTP
ncbi:MAG: thioredoxin family protein [Verrucomicrobia bacterium]|nr:thioredoxin family protein [Verrucomicrobiota bacterium]